MHPEINSVNAPTLSKEEKIRYNRQIMIFGEEGQKKLKSARVVVVGVGGLGSASSTYLTAAGVGRLILVDKDVVELDNLNRQVLHWTRDIGRLKVRSAAEKLRELNPEVDVEGLAIEVNEDSVYDIIKEANVVVDGLDNWGTRMIINKACVELGKPFVHAGVHGMYGQLTVIIPHESPCLQCIVPSAGAKPKSGTFPVLGTTPAILATLQAQEVIKLITGHGRPLIGKLLIFDGTTTTFTTIEVSRRKDCPVCGNLAMQQ
ncbi:MAG: HesA/MoeB/ThiF family protein [Desulfurococcales archaeon]|nr:HesA/MoeB/ThiF family protein [Desulfurococcales archaeon]